MIGPMRTAGILLSLLAGDISSQALAKVPPGQNEQPWRGVQLNRKDWTDKAFDIAAGAGFNFVRTGFYWYDTQKTGNGYDWSVYDDLVAKLNARGLRVQFTLFGGNRLFGVKDMPQGPAQVAAFSRWAAAAASHFRGQPVAWEIWNEPNGGGLDPALYTSFATPTCYAMRAANPSATILGGALSAYAVTNPRWPRYARGVGGSDLRTCVSAFTVHPYRDVVPETVASTYASIARDAPSLSPIVNGEWGYSTAGPRAIAEPLQAAYAARSFLASEAQRVNYNLWFTLRDNEGHAKPRERGFGLVHGDYSAKPALAAMTTLNRTLAGFHFAQACHAQGRALDASIYASAAGDRKLAFWSTGGPARLQLSAGDIAGPAIASDGSKLPAWQENGRIGFAASGAPAYVALSRAGAGTCEALRLT